MIRRQQSFMVKLKNIVIENDIAKSEIIVEDCETIGNIEVDLFENKIKNSVLPKGYEWCKKHLEYAKDYLIEVSKLKDNIPKEKTIMWC